MTYKEKGLSSVGSLGLLFCSLSVLPLPPSMELSCHTVPTRAIQLQAVAEAEAPNSQLYLHPL